MDTMTEYLPIAVVALVLLIGGAIAVRVLLPKLILKFTLMRLTPEEREAFPLKQELLEHGDIVEFFAPNKNHRKTGVDGKKPQPQQAWLSPFATAVRAANKRHKHNVKGGVILARAQVHEAARAITVATLPESMQPANAGADHFSIDLQLNGQPDSKVKALASVIRSQLGLHSLEQAEAPDYRTLRLIGHASDPVDPLTSRKAGAEFFTDHAAKAPSKLPLALAADGSVWSLPMHHTLILGMTGSGKGSPLQGTIRQLAPFINDGRARIYGIDHKNIELDPYQKSSLFERYAVDGEAARALIEHVNQLMQKRAASKKVDLEAGELGRSMAYTRETPLILFVIDEFLSLLLELQSTKEGQESIRLLTEVVAKGRSLGVILMAATQEADKELIGRMRNNFANFIVLKQPSAYFNDLFLGEAAAANGFDSTKIKPANQANGYATAGIGYVKGETGEPVRVRFAYSSDRDISDLILANYKEHEDELHELITLEEPGKLSPLDDDGDFGFSDMTPEEIAAEDDQDPNNIELPALY